MKFLKVIIIFFIFLSQSCIDLRSCPKNFFGKYICENNPNAENYIEIKQNGTFLHYYRENDILLTDIGTWKKSEDGYCYINLSTWKNFNELGRNFEIYGNGILYVSGEYLDISPDGESLNSFKRE